MIEQQDMYDVDAIDYSQYDDRPNVVDNSWWCDVQDETPDMGDVDKGYSSDEWEEYSLTPDEELEQIVTLILIEKKFQEDLPF